jgi:DNA-directed RNA polymerase specialized sigma24 family protein
VTRTADDGSFDEFARAQYASLTRYAIALTGNRHAADDLVQKTLANYGKRADAQQHLGGDQRRPPPRAPEGDPLRHL